MPCPRRTRLPPHPPLPPPPSLLTQRRSWHQYCKRLAKAAVGVSKWVKRLQEYVVAPPSGLVTNAQRALEVRGVCGGAHPAASCGTAAASRLRIPRTASPGFSAAAAACGLPCPASPQLSEITRHISAAVQEEYVASMEFVAAQFPVTTPLVQAYVNYRAAPYIPDLVAIVWQM